MARHNLCIGVPAIIGSDGLERILELSLNEDEKNIFNKGVLDIQQAVKMLTNA